jgi:hypothetical protein
MKTKKKICGRIFKRYQKAGKKGKAKILDGYAPLLGYNCGYLARLLTGWGKTRYAALKGKPVKCAVKPAVKGSRGQKTGRPEKYRKAFVKALTDIWELFDFQCGRLLAPLIRGMIAFLVLEFNLSKELSRLLQSAQAGLRNTPC